MDRIDREWMIELSREVEEEKKEGCGKYSNKEECKEYRIGWCKNCKYRKEA